MVHGLDVTNYTNAHTSTTGGRVKYMLDNGSWAVWNSSNDVDITNVSSFGVLLEAYGTYNGMDIIGEITITIT